MIRTFSARLRVLGRFLTGGAVDGRKGALSWGAPRFPSRAGGGARLARFSLASERGDTLIEVLISAMLVGLIVVGTLTGFNSATKASYDGRAHAQAAVCAQQDEERLRGLTTKQLSEQGTTSREVTDTCEPYVKTSGYKGTVYTVTSTAEYVNDKTVGTSCSPKGSADYLRTTSSVKWAALKTRKEVTQSSIVTNPIGSSLLVKIENQVGQGVPGATVTAVGENTNQMLTTNSEGCAIFGSLVAPSVTVTVTKTGWVDHEGEAIPPESLKLVTGQTTSVTYQLGEAGAIKAEFQTTSNKGLPEPTAGDTFVAFQNAIVRTPYFMLEGTMSSSEAAAAADYQTSVVSSPMALFPFQKPPAPGTPEEYTVYAGDCEKNNPEIYEPSFVNATAQVEPGEVAPLKKKLTTPPVMLTVPPVNINVWNSTEALYPGTKTVASGYAVLTNLSCKGMGIIPTNDYSSKTEPKYKHFQPLKQGHLAYHGVPYGVFELCVTNGTHYWKTTFENKKSTGPATPLTNAITKQTETIEGATYGNIFLSSASSGICE
jgi:type II secretory pathway pseudopilin PulG